MKRAITGLLLTFVIVTLIVQIAKSFKHVEAAQVNDGVNVLFFHAKVRCPTCTKMEELTCNTLKYFSTEMLNGKIKLTILDYDAQENRKIVEQFHVGTAAVVLVDKQKDDVRQSRNLAADCWKLIGDEPAFIEMLKSNIEEVLRGEEESKTTETEEIILDTEQNLFD